LRAAEIIVNAARSKVQALGATASLVPANAAEQENVVAPPTVPATAGRVEGERHVQDSSDDK
jgi:hypothetical protein